MRRIVVALITLVCVALAGVSGTWASDRTLTSASDAAQPDRVGVPEVPIPVLPEARAEPESPEAQPAAPAAYNLNWYSVNSGGAVEVASSSYRMGVSVGQAVAGYVAGTDYQLGVGFWYGAAAGGTAPCLVAATGDVNVDASLTAADIIYVVNYVFKGGVVPNPCEAAGDVTCDGSVTASDIIHMVNHVFKGGPAPCDVCTMIPGIWSCP